MTIFLPLFSLSGVNMAPPSFSLYLRHNFCSESEDVKGNRVKAVYLWLVYQRIRKVSGS